MHFFATAGEDEDALDPDEFIHDYGALGALTLRLIITYRWSSAEESDSDELPNVGSSLASKQQDQALALVSWGVLWVAWEHPLWALVVVLAFGSQYRWLPCRL